MACAKEQYSASDEDLEMVGCFLLFQEINEEPKKKQKPYMECLVSGHVPQSESTYPFSFKLEFAEKNRLAASASLRHFNTLNAAW